MTKWQTIDTNPNTLRLKIPGGWQLKIGGESSIFIADPSHSWEKLTAETEIPQPKPLTPTMPANKGHRIGTNIMELRDYCGYQMFDDLMRQSREWISGVLYGQWEDNRPVNLEDVHGNQVLRKVLFSSNTAPKGELELHYNHAYTTAKIELNGVKIISESPGRIVFEAVGETQWINAYNGTVGGFALFKKDSAHNGIFNAHFVKELAKYDTIRFMDLQQTNVRRTAEQLAKDNGSDYSISTKSGDAIPTNILVDLANAAECNAYFCLPINCTDQYVAEFIECIKDLKGLAYVELSNEMWNSIFPQFKHFSDDFDSNMTAFAERAGQVFGIIKNALGNQVKCVLAGQSSNIWWIENMMKIIKAEGLKLPDCISTAPYFYGISDVEVDDAIKQAKAAFDLAKANRMEYVAYECGQHLLGGDSVAINGSEEMGAAYRRYLSGLKDAVGDSLIIHFSLLGPWSSSGSWGLKQLQDGGDTPKSLVMQEFLKT